MRQVQTEVLVIGGGATGAGVLRDLAMRGFKAILVERHDWCSGTTGRYNGVLHSGSRYSLNDVQTAQECIQENRILRRIMPHCIEDTGGYLVATPWDDPAFGDHLIGCCQKVGIPLEEVPLPVALRNEPWLNPGIRRCLRAPDAMADSFLATQVNLDSARQYGAQAWNYHPVAKLLIQGGRVKGAECKDLIKGETVTILADLVVNAAGAWAGQIAAMAGVRIPIVCSKGSMIGVHYRLVNTAIIRLHWPADNDSVVPSHTVSVLGCNDVVIDDPDAAWAEPAEVQAIVEETSKLVPIAREMRKLRVWTGVRPLYQNNQVNGGTGRQLSRSHVILNHSERDGLDGLISIVGGKWTTYRLMAEQAVDEVCRVFGVSRGCRTQLEPLPGAQRGNYYWRAAPLARTEDTTAYSQLICECELVRSKEIEDVLVREDVQTLDDVRRATRLGMGTCQGGICALRADGLLHRLRQPSIKQVNAALLEFIQARWKGIIPVLSGSQLRQMRVNELIYSHVLGADRAPTQPILDLQPRACVTPHIPSSRYALA